jgi:CRP/FNR family cyclic AMP-dependent transcriptional regulator
MQTFRRHAPVDRLKSVDQFRDYTKAQRREVARLTEHVKVGDGEILVREGQIGKEFFLILSGTVEVTQKNRLVNTLGPGDFFGELAALNRGPRNATVTALSDLDVLIIGPREFNAIVQIPGFRDALLKRMASRLRTVDAQLAAALDGQEALGPGSPRPDWPSTCFTRFPKPIVTEAPHYSERFRGALASAVRLTLTAAQATRVFPFAAGTVGQFRHHGDSQPERYPAFSLD